MTEPSTAGPAWADAAQSEPGRADAPSTESAPAESVPTDSVPTGSVPTGSLPAGSGPTEPARSESRSAASAGAVSAGAVSGDAEDAGTESVASAAASARPAAVSTGSSGPDSLNTDSPQADQAATPASTEQADFDAAAVNWRRLSPRMLLVHPLQELRRLIIPLIALIVLGTKDKGALIPLIGLAFVVVVGMTRWFTTTYRVTPSQVQVRRGLLSRSTITVPRDRVRTVDITSHLLHRALGLARLTIGTGQSDRKKDEMRLDALTVGAAQLLRTELLHERPDAHDQPVGEASGPTQRPAVSSTVLAKLNPAWVRYAPFTLSGLVALGVFAGVTANFINQTRLDVAKSSAYREVRHDFSSMSWTVAALIIILAFVLVITLLSIGGYILQFWGFKLSRDGATLHVSRGLLTTRQTTIEERRLRGVEISEPLLLRWVHGARCVAITTGLRVGRGAERGGSILLPAAPAAEVDRVAIAVLEDEAPVRTSLVQHGRKAHRRRYSRAFLAAAIVTGIAAVLWGYAGWSVWFPMAALLLFPLGVYLAGDRYRNLGHAMAGPYIVARQGSAIRRRYILERDGIIGWNERQTFFQRRSGVATLKATTAAGRGGYEILDVTPAVGIAFADAATPGLLTPFLTTNPS
jgi:putative membrane protein